MGGNSITLPNHYCADGNNTFLKETLLHTTHPIKLGVLKPTPSVTYCVLYGIPPVTGLENCRYWAVSYKIEQRQRAEGHTMLMKCPLAKLSSRLSLCRTLVSNLGCFYYVHLDPWEPPFVSAARGT